MAILDLCKLFVRAEQGYLYNLSLWFSIHEKQMLFVVVKLVKFHIAAAVELLVLLCEGGTYLNIDGYGNIVVKQDVCVSIE